MVAKSLPRRKILLFTNDEYGQSSVVIATAYELMVRGCEVHISSFEASVPHAITKPGAGESAIRKRVNELNAGSYGPIPIDSIPTAFHAIDCLVMVQRLYVDGCDDNLMIHGPGIRETWRMQTALGNCVVAWGPDEYLQSVAECIAIIEKVDPDAIVVERLAPQPYDACTKLGKKIIQITPNSLLETVGPVQPRGFGIWGIGVFASGSPFPLPWYRIPINLVLLIRMVILMIFSPRIKSLMAARKTANIPGPYPIFIPWSKDNEYIIPTAPEIDYKFDFIPENVATCGPILIPSYPLSELDPELLIWLKRKPTILINFGSHMNGNQEFNRNIAHAIRILLSRNTNVQVLWKRKPEIGAKLDPKLVEILSPVASSVKEVPWIKAELVSLLRSGYIIANVNHGGANSFYEPIEAGIPQVILPCWLDTYDYARKVEYLGIGVWGSRICGQKLDAEEVGKALIRVTEDTIMQQEAKRLSEIMQTKYGGRKQAADKILELVESGWCKRTVR